MSEPDAKPELYLYLTTRGHKTGLPREIEIWFTAHHGCYYVIAEHPTSNWVRNLRANPEVQLRVAGKTLAARARILDENNLELRSAVQCLSQEKYGWSDGLVVELTPESANDNP
jgi:deazaflavin-dependent oxidoreductase (nitroreductase family)